MARFDVYAYPGGPGLLLDCQADLLDYLNTRLVAPLLPRGEAPRPARQLNPEFVVNGDCYVMVTQYAAAIECRDLGERIGSLAEHDIAILNALDMLIVGV
jgi:toxin CcdB